ncbi:MAG: Thiol peroxidase, Bcp-type [Myxococcaceae bacterium]|nr:Thiol peroxidase, Bcp-type [Myxococcaceae bacterium]
MLKSGDVAPDFAAVDCQGRPVKLSDLRGKKVVLFFFPKAFTPICTIEIRNFRDHQAAIEARNATLIGVSLDKPARQCEFAKSEQIDFALIGDESRAISESYGVVWPLVRRDRRATFLIDEQGRIEAVINDEVKVYRHLDDVLAKLGVPAS